MTDFDPVQHRSGESRYFEDFTLGETFYIPSDIFIRTGTISD